MIGDDAAFLPEMREQAVSVDSQREGVHFSSGTDPELIARRLVRVNLSDLAAVGAEPRFALCTLSAPQDYPRRRFFNALLDECQAWQLELCGGDLARSPSVECTLTVIGERQRRGRFLRRDAAKAGDHLYLVGPIGTAQVGLSLLQAGGRCRLDRSRRSPAIDLPPRLDPKLAALAKECIHRHLLPEPQIEMARWLAARRSAVAAIDISDGLLTDLGRLARSSGVALDLDIEALSSTDTDGSAFRELCEAMELDPLQARLRGGEDYSLAFTMGPRSSPPKLRARSQLRRIGIVRPGNIRPGTKRPETRRHGEAINLTNISARAAKDVLARPGWDHLTPIDESRESTTPR